MEDGLQLNLNVVSDQSAHAPKLGWRERKRQAREKQEQRRQRGRGRQAGRPPGAAVATAAAATVAAGVHHPAAPPKPFKQEGSQIKQQQQHQGRKPAAGSNKPDSLHGYSAVLSQQQQQQQYTAVKEDRKAAKPTAADERGKAASSKTAAAAAATKAPSSRPAKRPNPAEAAAAAAAASEAMTADEQADIMALVQLNLTVEQQLQAEQQQMQQQQHQQEEVGGPPKKRSRKQQAVEQAPPGVVEFGDAPDEPDYHTLAHKGSKQQLGSSRKGTLAQQQQKPQQQQKQQLAQHKIGEMAHAEPNVPAEQRQQLFGDSGAAGASGGAGGGVDDGTWSGLGLGEALSAHLVALNFQEPTQVQKRAIPVLLVGRDALVRSPTGSGKTLSYLAPIVHSLQAAQPRISRADGTHVVVLVPTRELAVQVSDVLTALVRRFCWLVPGMLIGGEHRGHEKARLRKGVTVLVATPGRLLDHLQNTSSFKTEHLSWLVLDEADRLLDLGFEAKLRSIVEAFDAKAAAAADNSYTGDAAVASKRQTVLLSATLHPGLAGLAGLSMKDPVGVGFEAKLVDGQLQLLEAGGGGAAGEAGSGKQQAAAAAAAATGGAGGKFELPQQLQQKYVEVPARMRLVALIGLLRSRLRRSKAAKLVVFFSNCDSVDFHHQLLLQHHHQQQQQQGSGYAGVDGAGGDAVAELLLGPCPVLKLHGDMKQPERTSSLVTFAKATSCVLLCTDVAARGLDFPAVSTIVQYDPAGDPAEYVHRVGRTARMGQQGEAMLFLLPSEMPYVQLLQQHGAKLQQEPVTSLLQVLPDLVGPGGVSSSVQQMARKMRRGGGKGDDAAAAAGGGSRQSRGAGADVAVPGWGGDEGLVGAKPEQVAAALLLQRRLVAAVSGDQELSKLALSAFRSFVRAYTTHPSALKHVFHVKSLHLGHLAAAFGLKEAPTKIGASGSAAERKKRKLEGQQAAAKKQKQAWHRTAKAAAAQGM